MRDLRGKFVATRQAGPDLTWQFLNPERRWTEDFQAACLFDGPLAAGLAMPPEARILPAWHAYQVAVAVENASGE